MRFLVLAFVAGASPWLAACRPAAAETVGSAPAAFHVVTGPYLNVPTETSMTVSWMADRASSGWVEYGAGDTLDGKAFAAEDGLRSNGRFHRVVVSGLAPGTTYRYRVVSREIVELQPYKVLYGATVASEVHSLRTLDARQPRCSFVVLNDNHERADLLRARLARAAERPYDLVFYNGDMLNHTDSEQQVVEKVLAPSAELFAGRVPFVWVRGNHEARGAFARELKPYAAGPNGRYYYAFNHGPVRFVILDSGEDKADDHGEYGGLTEFDAYREAEAAWLREEVESKAFKGARFRVALVHQPPFVLERKHNHGREHAATLWGPLLNRGVDLMLAAHLHEVRLVEPVPGAHDYPIVVGGGPKPGQGTVIRVDADADHLKVAVTGDDGALLAERTVRRR